MMRTWSTGPLDPVDSSPDSRVLLTERGPIAPRILVGVVDDYPAGRGELRTVPIEHVLDDADGFAGQMVETVREIRQPENSKLVAGKLNQMSWFAWDDDGVRGRLTIKCGNYSRWKARNISGTWWPTESRKVRSCCCSSSWPKHINYSLIFLLSCINCKHLNQQVVGGGEGGIKSHRNFT